MLSKTAIIEVTEYKELYLLNSISQSLLSLNIGSPLFLVGDWTRSKYFKKISYHYEMVCYQSDFEKFNSILYQIVQTNETRKYFIDAPHLTIQQKKKQKNQNQSSVIRLISVNGSKFKITLKCLKNDSLMDDFNNRDFTINALYFELNSKRLLFPNGDLSDFKNKIMRTLRSPSETFGGQINLFFRFIEFVIRYNLVIHSDIIQYFKNLSAKHDIFEKEVNFNQNNFNSTIKKFFSKHYVSEMLQLMLQLNLIDFFILDFKNQRLFNEVFSDVILLAKKLELSLKQDFVEFIGKTYANNQFPKVFYTKARIFLISFVFFKLDSNYASNFLKVFFYNNKVVSKECLDIQLHLHRLLVKPNPTRNEFIEQELISEVTDLINEFSFDKSKWSFLFVFKVTRDFLLDRNMRSIWTNLINESSLVKI